MNRSLALQSILLVVVSCDFSGISVAVSQDNPSTAEPPEIQSMEGALDLWLEETEFACTYKASTGSATSEENAKNGIAQISDQKSGVFNKAVGRIRISTDNEGEIEYVSEISDGGSVKNVDADEVSSDTGLMLRYNPQITPKDLDGTASFLPRDMPGDRHMRLGRFDAGPTSQRRLSPLSIDGNEVGSYLRATGEVLKKREVIESSAEQITIRVISSSGAYEVSKDVVFSLQYSRPVISEVQCKMQDGAGSEYISVSSASDFVEVPGGPVAKRVIKRSMFTKNGKPRDSALPWLVSEWRSEDLGARPVNDNDFLVPIKPTTMVQGVANPKAFMTDGKLDISKVTTSDLNIRFEDGELGGLAQAELKASSTGQNDRIIFWGVNLVAMIVIVSVVLFARRSKKGIEP